MIFIASLGGAGVFGCSCVLMIIGALLQNRRMMMPYLVLQMFITVMMAIVGIPVSVALFHLGHVLYGISISSVVIITSILPILFWFTVLKYYRELAEVGKSSSKRANQRDINVMELV